MAIIERDEEVIAQHEADLAEERAMEPTTGFGGLIRKPFASIAGKSLALPLMVLFFIYFFDEFDTAAFGTLAPEIQKAFHLTDNAFAFLVISNLSAVLLLGVVVGYFGDRLPRTKLVVAGAVMAGVATCLTGVVNVVGLLVVVRLLNGLGVLVNDPIHRSLLTDYYRPEERPQVFARHANAPRLGAVVGPMVAGIIGTTLGWRWAFIVLIIPILFMASVASRLKNPVRGETDDEDAALLAATERPVDFGRGVRMLFAVKTLRRQFLAWVFIGAGYLPLSFLVPLYYERVFGLGPFERGAIISAGAAAGFFGVQLAGRWTSGWMSKGMGEPLKYCGLTLGAVGPGLLVIAWAPSLIIAVPALLLTNFIAGMFTPGFLTVQALVSPARVRSLSFSFGSVFIVLGTWIWLLFFGTVSDNHGTRWALVSLAPWWVVGGLVLWSAHQFVTDDTTRAFDILSTTAALHRQREALGSGKVLVVRDLDVAYGPVQVLFGVDLELEEGEIVALLGTNGAGKSTLLRAISGLLPAKRGAIYFEGEDVTGLEPEDSFTRGLVQVPGGRGIFPGLTVKENLDVAAWATRRPRAETDAKIAELMGTFPALERRLEQPAAVLSGGEAQMLTLGQAFIAEPKLLMIDELSLGLAPIVVEDLLRIVRRIHESGTAIILVEQSVNVALTVADRAVFMEKGEVRFSGPTEDLLARDDVLRAVFLTGAGSLETGF